MSFVSLPCGRAWTALAGLRPCPRPRAPPARLQQVRDFRLTHAQHLPYSHLPDALCATCPELPSLTLHFRLIRDFCGCAGASGRDEDEALPPPPPQGHERETKEEREERMRREEIRCVCASCGEAPWLYIRSCPHPAGADLDKHLNRFVASPCRGHLQRCVPLRRKIAHNNATAAGRSGGESASARGGWKPRTRTGTRRASSRATASATLARRLRWARPMCAPPGRPSMTSASSTRCALTRL